MTDNPNTAEESHPLAEMQRQLQEMKGQILDLSARDHARQAELIEIRNMIELRSVRNT